MPIYEYVCNDCNTYFEEIVLKEEKIRCPKCNGQNTKRLLSICRTKVSGGEDSSMTSSSSSSCAGCSGGNCSTCGG